MTANEAPLARLASAAAALALCACHPAGPAQDVDFVQGCWVLRWNSDQSVSMRTHFESDAQSRTYRAVIREFGDASDPGEDNYEFIVSRDGRWLEMDNHAPDSVRRLSSAPRPRLAAAKPPAEIIGRLAPVERLAAFRFEDGEWVLIALVDDQLAISQVHADGKPGQTYAAGRREPCD